MSTTRSSRASLWACAIVGALACVGSSARPASAQTVRGNVTLVLPPSTIRDDTLITVTPTLFVQTTNFADARPLRVTLQVDTTPRFASPLVAEYETSVQTLTSTATIAPALPLPERTRVYFRATVTDPLGNTATSAMLGPVNTPAWVTPVSPPTVAGQPVRTRTPRFVWRSPSINEPPGPWAYSITITNVARQEARTANVGSDTTFVPAADLEANAVYTWSITARAGTTIKQTVVPSPYIFVVEDAAVPTLTTSLSPPFPSPFPVTITGTTTDATCVWFDLRAASSVTLDVYDLRGVHVRRLVPNGEIGGVLSAGRYGRGRTELNEGCDSRFAWNGTDDRGRTVPEGVYLIRFVGDGREFTRKVLFRGR